jgi:Zn-dependent protease with chaperone function/type II secretory pathway pseudopilin PulG
MEGLVYPRERTLGAITLILGIMVWVLLIFGTVGTALIALAISFVLYLFVQSTLIAHIKGHGVELTAAQFPDLYAQFVECGRKLQMKELPQAYVLCGNGGLNAFATKFLGTQYVVLLSDVVDAMNKHTDGVRFYIGHEMGHLRMKHLDFGHLLRWPVLWLPLLGAAYARARESTCDRHGLACGSSPTGAAQALAALGAGVHRWEQLDVNAYMEQTKHTSGFWMSFHELTSGYPWLTKRVARVMNNETVIPKRNGLAYLLALFTPYAGRLGGGFGLLIMIYIIAVVSAVALPAYQDYTGRAALATLMVDSQAAQDALASYYEANEAIPDSLEAVNVDSQLSNGRQMVLDPESMTLSISTEFGEFLVVPSVDDDGNIFWQCTNGEGMRSSVLPAGCYASE